MSVWRRQTSCIRKHFFFFIITLNQFANMCLNMIYVLCNCAVICCLCWCYFLCILACSSSVSRENGLLYCEHNARLSFADLVIAGIHYHFQLFYQWFTEAFERGADISVLHIGPFWPKFLCFRYGNLGYGLSKEQIISFYFSSSHPAPCLLQHKMAFHDVCTFVSLNIGVFSTYSSHCAKREEHGWALLTDRGHNSVIIFSGGPVSLENWPIRLPAGNEFITEPHPHWSTLSAAAVWEM